MLLCSCGCASVVNTHICAEQESPPRDMVGAAEARAQGHVRSGAFRVSLLDIQQNVLCVG